jgi:hypothetical protein
VNCVGIDLHKKTIVLCVLDQHRRVVARRSFACCDTEGIVAFFTGLRPFQAVVEATASSEWLVERIEPLADQVVLANPSTVYEIAHSKKKTDHHDAQVLAEMDAATNRERLRLQSQALNSLARSWDVPFGHGRQGLGMSQTLAPLGAAPVRLSRLDSNQSTVSRRVPGSCKAI